MTSEDPRSVPRPRASAPGLLCAALLAVLLPGCDGGSGPDPVPSTPPPPAPVTTVIGEGSFSGVPPQGAIGGFFTTTRAGDLEFVVDWTFASNDVDLALFRGECSEEQFIAGQCDLADLADSTTAKPERVGIAGAAAGTYTLVVANLGETEESISYQVLLTTVGSAAEGNPRSSSRGAGPGWRPARGLGKTGARLP